MFPQIERNLTTIKIDPTKWRKFSCSKSDQKKLKIQNKDIQGKELLRIT